MPTPGREVWVYAKDASGVDIAVGEQTNWSVDATASTTEIGHKLSSSKTVLTSSISRTANADALLLYDDEAQVLVEQAMIDQNPVTLIEKAEGVSKWQYRAFVTGLRKNYPEEGASTWSSTFSIDGSPIKLG